MYIDELQKISSIIEAENVARGERYKINLLVDLADYFLNDHNLMELIIDLEELLKNKKDSKRLLQGGKNGRN